MSAPKQIDQLVYELYGLTDQEIRIVEEAIYGWIYDLCRRRLPAT